jgi:uncharacterized protein (DUF305 family)
MAGAEVAMGKDGKSKEMAQEIINARRKEIEEMTSWVEERAKQ